MPGRLKPVPTDRLRDAVKITGVLTGREPPLRGGPELSGHPLAVFPNLSPAPPGC